MILAMQWGYKWTTMKRHLHMHVGLLLGDTRTTNVESVLEQL